MMKEFELLDRIESVLEKDEWTLEDALFVLTEARMDVLACYGVSSLMLEEYAALVAEKAVGCWSDTNGRVSEEGLFFMNEYGSYRQVSVDSSKGRYWQEAGRENTYWK